MNNISVLDGIQLYLLKREVPLPFKMDIAASGIHTGAGAELECYKILRFLPERRLVCLAEYEAQRVVAKLFIHPDKAEKDYEKELAGYELLHKAQVLTPKLLTSGSLNNAGFYVLYQYITAAATLQENIAAVPNEGSARCLENLIPIIAQMHNSDIQQVDLHLNNFLLSEQQLYTIDCGDVVKLTDNSLTKTANIYKNLADVLSQLPVVYDRQINEWLALYQSSSDLTAPLNKAGLCQEMNQWRAWRIKKYLKKCARNCSEFIVQNSRGEFRVNRREYRSPDWMQFYAQLDERAEASKRLKDGNTATVALTQCEGRKLVIKRYNIKNFRHWLKRCWRPSRAWTCWQNAHRLKVLGIKTPQPVAVLEERFGWLRQKAFYVSEYEPAEDALAVYYQKDEVSEQHLKDFAGLFTAMVYARMSHGDMKANNILLTENGLSLIDLDAMKFHHRQQDFAKAFERDCQRFLRNWRPESRVYQQFKVLLQHLPSKPMCG